MAKQTIGDFLSTLRKANGYTQQEIADRLGISNRTLSGWECNKVLPDILLLPVLAELYGVTVDEILAGERKNREEAVISSKTEKKLYRRKIAKFDLRIWVLTGFTIIALCVLFLAVCSLELTDSLDFGDEVCVWMIVASTPVAVVCFSLILLFWHNAEISVDDAAELYPSYCIILRKKLAICLYTLVAWTFAQALIAMYIADFNRADAMFVNRIVTVIVCFMLPLMLFVATWYLFKRAINKFGGEKGARYISKDRQFFFTVALFGLIPAVMVTVICLILVFVRSISLSGLYATYIVVAVLAVDIVICSAICVKRRLSHYSKF